MANEQLICPPDYHIHTRFSCDSDAEMAAVCEAAITRELSEIAFTDHADFGPADPPGYFRPAEYLAGIERCRARYGDRLTIRAGVEMGEPHIFAQEAGDVLAVGDFDFVLGSAHYAEGLSRFGSKSTLSNRYARLTRATSGRWCVWPPRGTLTYSLTWTWSSGMPASLVKPTMGRGRTRT
ncbi:MAG: hypothetical protein DRI81_00030 [Chloroflexi bacterium]|nr:MAG: hypothetical protein DRI81_00030 [Chloroflexota bacterium]